MNRRELLQLVVSGAVLSRCVEATATGDDVGRLTARPSTNIGRGRPGTFALRLGTERDGFLHVPREGTLPLLLMLHGAGGNARRVTENYRDRADEFGFMMLVPDSRDMTWDRVHGDFGPDIEFINHALEKVFANYDVDRRRIGIGGFSDGASYALSAGITNGDLFTHILAFSPGFAEPAMQRGRPRLFFSHGTQDDILPIDDCSRRLVPAFRSAGYQVEYIEFDGPHTVPREVAARGFTWFTKS